MKNKWYKSKSGWIGAGLLAILTFNYFSNISKPSPSPISFNQEIGWAFYILVIIIGFLIGKYLGGKKW